ncbi:NAD-dependent succinate-semialdehyde dehydrogenase [Candidatus Pacearchaeota archaeon]|nr:NAD-dependent succinate-semialdehyde dehydrogenase [Candidatus Pacearchaeota archaeon]
MKISSFNPATEEVIKSYSYSSPNEMIHIVESARKAFLSWKEKSVQSRAAHVSSLASLLRKRSNELADLISREMGKPIKESISEIEKCAWLCDYFSDNAVSFLQPENIKTEAKRSYVTFEPLGIVLGIMPWNFPFWQVFRYAIPALCAGNVCILKHSANVPGCSKALQEIFDKSFPKHVFNSPIISSDTASQLVEKSLVQGVSLTGSVEAGRNIGELAGKNIKKVVLELGGSDPFIILEDADFSLACKTAVQSRMVNGGQSCIAAKRFIVVQSKKESFESNYLYHLNLLKIGNPLDKTTDVGPLARKDLVDKLDLQVKDALRKGAKLLKGGSRMKMKGYYYLPTLITHIKPSMKIFNEEIFGPVAVVSYVKNADEAIKEANRTQFGLGASLWTGDLRKAEELAKKIEAGMVFINGMVKSDPRLPFGGIKNSGVGRELSYYGIKEFVNIKSIVIN